MNKGIFLKSLFYTAAIASCFLNMLLISVHADDIIFEAFVDKKQAAIGEGIELGLFFSGVSQIPSPEIPPMEGFQVRYLGPATRLSMTNGRTEQSVTHRYLLIPLKEGVFRFGPVTVIYKGITYKSQEIILTIGKGVVSRTPAPSAQATISDNLSDRIFLTAEADRPAVYLNEAFDVTIRLYRSGINVTVDEYPKFDTQGFIMDPFEPARQFRQDYNGMIYDVVEFKTRLFATMTGDFVIGPVHLNCNILIRRTRGMGATNFESFFGQDFLNGFFGGYETVSMDIKAPAFSLSVLPFPESARPKDFTGAVGDFSLFVSVYPKEVNVGDPITVKMAIKGDGNFNSVTCPVFSGTKDFKIYEPQVRQGEGEKDFEQIVLPRCEEIKEIPAVNFSFFNPRAGTFQTLSKGPFPVKVNAPETQEKASFVEAAKTGDLKENEQKQEVLGKDIIFIKTSIGYLRKQDSHLYKSGFFWFWQSVVFVIFSVIVFWHRKAKRLEADISYARRLQAPKRAKKHMQLAQKHMQAGQVKDFYDLVFKMIKEYIGGRFQISAGSITVNIVDELLKEKNISPDILNKIKHLFDDCDMIRYAPAVFDQNKMFSTYAILRECMDYFEKKKD